jgi:transposase-like protein
MAQIASRPTGAKPRRWPATVRQRALRLAAEHGLAPADVRRGLAAEGFDVPAETVRSWLRSPAAQPSDPASLRDRIYRLASRELAKLETSPVGKADLRRLESLGRILKTAETERPNRQQAKGLERLAQIADETDSDETPIEQSAASEADSREP